MDYNGETTYKGWGEEKSNLFRMYLTNDGTTCIIPDTDSAEYGPSSGVVMNMTWSVKSVYKNKNKSQLIKYYHTSVGSHPKRTLLASTRAGTSKGVQA